MNYYQYKKRVPAEKRGSDYLKPFLFILLFIAIIFGGWKLLSYIFNDDSSNQSDQKVLLELESGSAKAMNEANPEWTSVRSGLDLFEGEKVRTQSDGRLTLDFFDGTIARLDKSSEIEFVALEQDDTSTNIELSLNGESGSVWINNSEVLGSQTLSVRTEGFVAHAEAGSIFSITAPHSLYVIKGGVQADIMEDEKIIKTANVGIGQQLLLTDALIADLSEGLNKEILFALDDDFKTSNWYRWNQQKEGTSLTEDEEADSNAEEEDPNSETTGGDEEDPTDEENDPDDTDENEDEAEEDEDDSEGPATPQITKPSSNGGKITLSLKEQIISGTVSADTQKVVVNGYQLSKYVPGSKTFTYSAKTSLNNLKVGENTYSVVAIDEAGNKSKTASITLVLPQSVAGEEDEDEDEETPAASTGEVKITSPNGGANLKTSETAFVISGTAPSNTSKVLVNGYQLQGYAAGSGTFKYNATAALGTLKVGQTNSYTVKAYDKNDAVIGSATMTIEVSGDAAATPPSETPSEGLSLSITMPTSAANYQTTLNEVVLGGTVDTSVEDLYVNGIKLDSFAPGTGEWKMSVQLRVGDNTYNVYGQKGGTKTNSDSITINYQN